MRHSPLSRKMRAAKIFRLFLRRCVRCDIIIPLGARPQTPRPRLRPNEGIMEKLVFISHAHEADGKKADRIVEYLESHGIGCFIAPRDITKGASYAPKLVAGIDAATVVLLIGTPAIVGREHILNEIEIAQAQDHRPIRHRGLHPVRRPRLLHQPQTKTHRADGRL